MTTPSNSIVLQYLDDNALIMRNDSAFLRMRAAAREFTRSSLQRAYRLVRQMSPTAAILVIDGSEEPENRCWIAEVRDADNGVIWRLDDVDRPRHLEVPEEYEDAAALAAEALCWSEGRTLPGWREQRRHSGIWTVDMQAVPNPLLLPSCHVNPAVLGVVEATVAGWPSQALTAALSYGALLVSGTVGPVQRLSQWSEVAMAYEQRCGIAVDARSVSQKLDQRAWEAGIARVHGMGCGAVAERFSGAEWGTSDRLHARVTIHPQHLSDRGLTLMEFAGAFAGPRSCAVALLRTTHGCAYT